MNESKLYFEQYLNNQSTTLSFYVPRLLNKKLTYIEKYNYINRVNELINEYLKIENSLKIEKVVVNKFFNLLSLVQDIVPLANELLEKLNYDDFFSEKYAQILQKLKDNAFLYDDEKEFVEYLIEYDLIKKEDKNFVYDYYIRFILLKNKYISFDSFKKIMLNWCELKVLNFNATVSLSKYSKELKKRGIFEGKVYLNESKLYEFYHTGNYETLFDIFRQIANIKLADSLKNKNNDKYVDKMLKEEILVRYISNYYETNKDKISYEVYANIVAIHEIIKLFSKYKINFENGKNPYFKKLQELTIALEDESRKVAGRTITVDKTFELLIKKKTNALSSYEALKTACERKNNDYSKKC